MESELGFESLFLLITVPNPQINSYLVFGNYSGDVIVIAVNRIIEDLVCKLYAVKLLVY